MHLPVKIGNLQCEIQGFCDIMFEYYSESEMIIIFSIVGMERIYKCECQVNLTKRHHAQFISPHFQFNGPWVLYNLKSLRQRNPEYF